MQDMETPTVRQVDIGSLNFAQLSALCEGTTLCVKCGRGPLFEKTGYTFAKAMLRPSRCAAMSDTTASSMSSSSRLMVSSS